MDHPHQALIHEVRRADRDRYLAIQLAAPQYRLPLYLLVAIAAEIARIAELVEEPLAGHMRLAWWRETLADASRTQHPWVKQLANSLPSSSPVWLLLDDILDARAADLEEKPFPEEAAWQEYCRRTAGNLHEAISWICAPQATEAARAAIHESAIAYAMLGHWRAVPHMLAQGWQRLPQNLLTQSGLQTLAPSPALNSLGITITQIAQTKLNSQNPDALPCPPLRFFHLLARRQAQQIRRRKGNPYNLPPMYLASAWLALRSKA